jgi:hypothetical protein
MIDYRKPSGKRVPQIEFALKYCTRAFEELQTDYRESKDSLQIQLIYNCITVALPYILYSGSQKSEVCPRRPLPTEAYQQRENKGFINLFLIKLAELKMWVMTRF